jgi:EpsI family protein
MIARRDFIIAAACMGAAGAAYGLTPRRRLSLLAGRSLARIVPSAFGQWTSEDVTDLVAPAAEGTLASRLYGQTVERKYRRASSDTEIMMLIAHGDTQTSELQLHRPEVCYPAFGFEISANRATLLPLSGAVTLPARSLVAEAPQRRENIVYWTRLGEFLPVNGREQRADRLKTAFTGVVADGVLARLSIVAADPLSAFESIQGFVPDLITAMAASSRAVLIGTARAEAMAAAGR